MEEKLKELVSKASASLQSGGDPEDVAAANEAFYGGYITEYRNTAIDTGKIDPNEPTPYIYGPYAEYQGTWSQPNFTASLTGRPTSMTTHAKARANRKLNRGPAKATMILSRAEIGGNGLSELSLLPSIASIVAICGRET